MDCGRREGEGTRGDGESNRLRGGGGCMERRTNGCCLSRMMFFKLLFFTCCSRYFSFILVVSPFPSLPSPLSLFFSFIDVYVRGRVYVSAGVSVRSRRRVSHRVTVCLPALPCRAVCRSVVWPVLEKGMGRGGKPGGKLGGGGRKQEEGGGSTSTACTP